MSDPVLCWREALSKLSGDYISLPDEAGAVELAESLVVTYPGDWNKLLLNKGVVINPASSDDLFDIGTINKADPPVFTALTADRVKRAKCQHARQYIIEFLGQVEESYQVHKGVTLASDTGKTSTEITDLKRTDGRNKVTTVVGDRNVDDDPEPAI